MRSICFFASHSHGEDIPYYITVYLRELKKHFTEVILVSTQQKISREGLEFLQDENIRFFSEENEGFDFGLWYKAFRKINVLEYDQVALVNDSCILFKPLDAFMAWANTNPAELLGITRSEAIRPHIQSYFLIIRKKAIQATLDYFNRHKLLKNISEVISIYEVGLSSYLISMGFAISAFIDNNGYTGEFSPYYHCVDYHISRGIPVIKKKIMFGSYRNDELFTLARMNFIADPEHYELLITHYNKDLILDFKKLKQDSGKPLSAIRKLKYDLTRKMITLLRPLYKKFKHA